MKIASKPNIFNIPSNYSFFDCLNSHICDNFKNKDDLTIIFPNRRSCREFKKINKSDINLNIKAISELEISDFSSFFPQNSIKELIKEASEIKRLSNIDYLFFLSQEIKKTEIFKNIDLSQSLNIAISLKNIFDDIQKEQIDIRKIYDIDDSNLSKHRQFSLDFLKEFYIEIENKTIKNNIFSDSNWQNFIINKFSELINQHGINSDLIIAGSTGSISYSQNLIKSVSKQEKGHIFLYGFNNEEKFDEYQQSPQFILHNLIKEIEIDKKEIIEVKIDQFKLSSDHRVDFVNKALIPSEKTYLWNDFSFNKEELVKDFSQNIKILEAKNELKEAQLIIQEIKKQDKNCGIIINSDKFGKIIKTELVNNNLEFNDTRNLNIKDSNLINLILLVCELVKNDFDSANLLSILKHPLILKEEDVKLVEKFEIEILRSQRISNDLSALKHKISNSDEELQDFFNNFISKIENIKYFKGLVNFSEIFSQIISTIEDLTDNNIQILIENEKGKDEIAEIFDKLKSTNNFEIKSLEISEFLSKIFLNISYFSKSDSSAKIQLISPIEARLLNFDLIFITSLNYAEFPEISSDNWLGKKIRNDLEIDFSDKKYGQNLYDFCNYFSNKSVILTRSIFKNNNITLASPIISRLEILFKKIDFSLPKIEIIDNNLTKSENKTSFKPAKIDLKYRPKSLSVSDISVLMKDPYQIYARKILKLKSLDEIDYEPGNREFGSFIHKVLDDYIENKITQDNFLEKSKIIFKRFFVSENSEFIWWPKFENIFNNFIKTNKNLDYEQDFSEISGQITIENTKINAKIDRISLKNNQLDIFDYKTGQIASKKDVLKGIQPQLLIYGLILRYGDIERKISQNFDIRSLNYWKLSSFMNSEMKVMVKEDDIEEILENSLQGLKELISYYENEENSYQISLNQDRIHEYSHLERIF